MKHSQIGFLIVISDVTDAFSIVNWHSSRSIRRTRSTEEAELMAIDAALRSVRNMRMIIFQLVKREVPVTVYIENSALCGNLMK